MVGGWVGGGEQAQFCHGHKRREQNSVGSLQLDRDSSGSSWTGAWHWHRPRDACVLHVPWILAYCVHTC